MEAIEMIKGRRSIRQFKDEPVSRDLMEEIMDITRYAPSWTNSQTPRYTLVDDKSLIEQFASNGVKGFVYNIDTLKNATGVAVLSFVEGKSGRLDKYELDNSQDPTKWEHFDAGISCQTFCLAAHALGVATCIFGVIDEEKIADLINLPEEETVAALIVYGYPNQEAKTPRRKEVSDIARFL